MLTKVKNAVHDYGMVEKGDNIIVALSGGADSVSLLHCLLQLRQELGITLCACHLNHNLRGEESDRDELFVRTLCEDNEIQLYTKSVDVLSKKEKHQSTEDCARQVRYQFFEEISVGKKIATAHTASDNIETVLFNLVRGSALKGLCGIPPIRGNIIRPLIYSSREEIEQYCTDNHLQYVTDSTNSSDEYSRNYIRQHVIPKMKTLNPSLTATVSRMTTQLRSDEEFLTTLAQEGLAKCENGSGRYDCKILKTYPNPIKNRIIALILSQNNISPSALIIKGVTKIVENGTGKINIQKNTFAIVKKNEFFIEFVQQNYRK